MTMENTETVSATGTGTTNETEVGQLDEKAQKRHYTRKQDMEAGNKAILGVLATTAEGALNKKEILAKLSEDDKKLVLQNWNLRLAFLEETGEIDSVGRKVSKKYFKSTETN